MDYAFNRDKVVVDDEDSDDDDGGDVAVAVVLIILQFHAYEIPWILISSHI
jgi:hypothetical protein